MNTFPPWPPAPRQPGADVSHADAFRMVKLPMLNLPTLNKPMLNPLWGSVNMSGHRLLQALVTGVFLACAPLTAEAQEPPKQEQAPAPNAGEAGAQPHAEEAAKPEDYIEIPDLAEGAGRAECVWFGRRAVNLLWRDDIDTAKRHMSLYDRFECPGSHLQNAFRCIVRQGPIDPKQPETLNAKVGACWRDPSLEPPPPPPPAPAEGQAKPQNQ